MKKTLSLFLVLAPGSAMAGGIVVGEAGSQAMERAGAFVAKADDPTALSVNPAGIVKTRGVEIYLGGNLLNMNLTFQRAGNYPKRDVGTNPEYAGSPFPEVSNGSTFQPVPYLASTQKWRNLAFAEGLYAPAGVPNRDFDCTFSDDYCQIAPNGAPLPNRYDVVHQEALVAHPSVAVAYRILPSLDVGVRFTWGIASIKARNFPWALPNTYENPKAEGDFDADVTDMFVPSFGAGVLFRPHDNVEIGAEYTSQSSVHAKGTGDARLGPEIPLMPIIEPNEPEDVLCEQGSKIAALKTCINLKLPQHATLGGRYIFRDAAGGERADVELDVRWENWSNASDDEIIVDGRDSKLLTPLKPVINKHGFRDVVSFRLGGAYKIDVAQNALTLRGGASYDTAAAPTSWTRTDKDGRARTILSAGAAYDLGRFRFDLGFAVALEGEIVVSDVAFSSPPTVKDREQPDPLQPQKDASNTEYHPINAGTYSSNYIIGSLGFTAAF